MSIISIDIGSTYTKGARFSLENARLRLEKYDSVPTTADHLSRGFAAVANRLLGRPAEAGLTGLGREAEIFFSSSAKGGLKIAAVGIVPELTLNMAKMTALSAGGKITAVFSYKLCADDLKLLRDSDPDIILLTGGTDGGNESYLLHNARMLAALDTGAVIICAGNRSVADTAAKLLAGKEFCCVANVLPELEIPNPEPAREKIKEIFLKKIVSGRGMTEIVEQVGREPLPTPYAMFEYLKKFPEYDAEWQEFCVIDMGGATTDFYSCCEDRMESTAVIRHGVPEPKVKRTVEGDLGMRVSAAAAWETAQAMISEELCRKNLAVTDFAAFIAGLDKRRDFLPNGGDELIFDRLLAEACVFHAARRHAGTREKVYTPQGEVWLQKGKNIRSAKRLIGTGGYLSGMPGFSPWHGIVGRLVNDGKSEILLPPELKYYTDSGYLLTVLSNIAFKYPAPAVAAGIANLEPQLKTRNIHAS